MLKSCASSLPQVALAVPGGRRTAVDRGGVMRSALPATGVSSNGHAVRSGRRTSRGLAQSSSTGSRHRGWEVRAAVDEDAVRTTEEDSESAADGDGYPSFSWTEAWYPVGTLENLHEDAPNTFRLLDKGMVAWMGKDGTWSAAVEECPHKLASLGLGKVDPQTGDIVCRYHGWCFNSAGQCTNNPQAPSEAVAKTACSSTKSALQTFPAAAKHGLLWVWPSSTSPPQGEPNIDLERTPSSWTQVNNGIGYTFMVENSMDPSHSNWLHEGLGSGGPEPFAPENARPMEEFEMVGQMTAQGGFTLRHGGYKNANQGMNAKRSFTPPCTQITEYEMPNGMTSTFVLLFVPAEPGRTKVFLSFVFTPPPAGGGKSPFPPAPPKHLLVLKAVKACFQEPLKTVLLALAPAYLSTALNHMAGMGGKLGLQDMKAMHAIEVAMTSRKLRWAKEYYLPTPSDMGTITFRRWLDKFGGGGPAWQGTSSPTVRQMTDTQVLDRWDKHTKDCKSCRKSITWLEGVQRRLTRMKGYLQVSAVFLALGAAAGALMSVKAAISFGALSLLLLSLGGLAGTAASGVEDMQRGFFTGVSSAGSPMVDLYPHEKTGDKAGV